MFDWKKICCPLDFSEPSRQAFELAADLSKRLGSELTLLHVRPLEEGVLRSPPELFQRLVREEEESLAQWAEEARALGAPSVRVALSRGQPAWQIVRFAADEKSDLIVMGTHGHTGIKHAVFGSVTEAVVRTATCPVLTLRPSAAGLRAGLGATASGGSPGFPQV